MALNLMKLTLKNVSNILHPSDDESVNREAYENNADIQLELERLRELEEVQVLINKLGFENSFTAEKFVLYDDFEVTTEMISDYEILKAVQPNNQEKEEIEKEPLPTITHNKVIECYDKVILYLQCQEKNYGSNDEDIKFIKKLKKEALRERFCSTKQINLDNFVNVIE
ncbi:hypothetical protein RhiirB3_429626 [Rhizophagus irregularis]|nr:hypothetical protein RhiirB3_429626 [Rhizophagus irregularis]